MLGHWSFIAHAFRLAQHRAQGHPAVSVGGRGRHRHARHASRDQALDLSRAYAQVRGELLGGNRTHGLPFARVVGLFGAAVDAFAVCSSMNARASGMTGVSCEATSPGSSGCQWVGPRTAFFRRLPAARALPSSVLGPRLVPSRRGPRWPAPSLGLMHRNPSPGSVQSRLGTWTWGMPLSAHAAARDYASWRQQLYGEQRWDLTASCLSQICWASAQWCRT